MTIKSKKSFDFKTKKLVTKVEQQDRHDRRQKRTLTSSELIQKASRNLIETNCANRSTIHNNNENKN